MQNTNTPKNHAPHAGTNIYVVALSTVSFLAAFLTVGLVSPWGHRFPRWFPRWGGRPIDPRRALLAACAGIALLAIVYRYASLNPVFHWREPNDGVPGCPPANETGDAWIAYLAYSPILAGLPLLCAVTTHFYLREIGTRTRPLMPRSYEIHPQGRNR